MTHAEKTQENIIKRPPVVAIMGHVDHGKSTLLDYIRKTNIVAGEAGGITQHLSAYEVDIDGEKITFIDTPGHAAFDNMRDRSGAVADIAILIISAEDGVKQQTKHAIEVIQKHHIPFLVAINKIDKPNADPEKVKMDLLEAGIYLEGYGGDIPYVAISAKKGTGVDELLQTILLLAEMEEIKGDISKHAHGFVIESERDSKKGITATLIIKDGEITKGQFVVVEDSMVPTRMLANFKGKAIERAHFSSPIKLSGFDTIPRVGGLFETYDTKKEAMQAVDEYRQLKEELKERAKLIPEVPEGVALIPIILKTDVAGTAEAIEEEIKKKTDERVIFKIIKAETGNISESDIQLALTDERTVILGFHTQEDPHLKNINGYENVSLAIFDVIYELSEWLDKLYEERKIKREVKKTLGKLRILKVFSQQKQKILLGGEVVEGVLSVGDEFYISEQEDGHFSYGRIMGIQEGKQERKKVEGIGTQCGMMVETKGDIHEGSILEAFVREWE